MTRRANKPKPIFISYRHSDSASITNHIYQVLNRRFKDKVFMDHFSPLARGSVREKLKTHLNECTVVIIIIGRKWLTATGTLRKRRLDDPGDLVRWEVKTALERKVKIITLLVEGAQPPARDRLPGELSELSDHEYLHIRDGRDFERDIERLVGEIEEALFYGGARRALRHFYFKYERLVWTMIGSMTMAMIFLVLLLIGQHYDLPIRLAPPRHTIIER